MTTQNTTVTWIVEYSDHDRGAQGGHFIRKSEADAKRIARLLGKCGYQTTSYRQFTR